MQLSFLEVHDIMSWKFCFQIEWDDTNVRRIVETMHNLDKLLIAINLLWKRGPINGKGKKELENDDP